jgi:zinc protease
MKTKILSLVAILAMSFAVSAQIDRSKMPKAGPAPKVKLGEAKKFTLKNGLTVIMVENHKLPRASATLTIDNSPTFEGDKAGLSSMMGSLLGRGTSNISKDDFNERVDYLGASVGFSSRGAYGFSLKKYFPEILELMADGVKNSLFTQEEFDKELKITLDNIKQNEKNVATAARRVESVLTYGKNHPFGEFITKESVKNITLEDVKNRYNTYYKPNNAYLIIQGDINPKKIKKMVKKLFSDWDAGNLPTYKMPEVPLVETTEIDFIDMPNAVQSEIAVINTVNLTLGDEDYYAALLANQILGGGGTGRLFQNLREDKGYTYGSYSSVRQSRYVGTFRATASVRNTVTDSSVVELMKEINSIRYQKVSEQDLKDAKEAYIGSFVMDVQKPSTSATYALNKELYNLPDDYYENYLEKINSVTVDDVQNAAKKYFKANNTRIIVTGKAIDALENLEKNPDYKINYFDKFGNAAEKPELKKALPKGFTKETVINNYFKAIGGVEKIKNLETTLVTYEASAMGQALESTEKRNASKFANVVSMGGNVMMKVIMSKEAITMNGQALPPNMVGEMNNVLGTFPEIGVLADTNSSLTGIEMLDGKEVYVITSKGKVVNSFFFYDVKTGLKVKESQSITMGQRTQNQEVLFSDYKDYNGIMFPAKKIGSLGPQKVSYTLKEVKINEGVTDKDFE